MLEGQIAIVTGASRGIGRAIALALGKQGATVIGTATTPQGAETIGAALSEAGCKGRGVVLNVTDTAGVDAAIADVEAHEGAATILVNNAGITRDALLLRMKPDDWQAIMDTNLSSVFRLSKACLRGMMKQRAWPHHQHCIRGRADRQCRPGELRGCQSGHHRIQQIAGARGRIAWHHRERGCSGIHRYRHDTGPE